MRTRITELFGIAHPIVQGGMHYAEAEQIIRGRLAGLLDIQRSGAA